MDECFMINRDPLFASVMRVCAPLLVWAAHFFFCYAYVAAGCASSSVLWTTTALALSACCGLLWLSWRERVGKGSLLDCGAFLASVFSFIAITWSTLPLLFMSVCRFT
jgi:hypothetical protein